MNTRQPDHVDAGTYELRIDGRLDERWSAWFDGLSVTTTPGATGPDGAATDGVTVLRGPVADQAALHGLLARLHDLGLTLISVTRVEPGESG